MTWQGCLANEFLDYLTLNMKLPPFETSTTKYRSTAEHLESHYSAVQLWESAVSHNETKHRSELPRHVSPHICSDHLSKNTFLFPYNSVHIYFKINFRTPFTERGGADKSLARPTSRCHRTKSIVSLERRVCSCAELSQRLKGNMSGDTRDFNNMETRTVIIFFCKTRRGRKFTPFWQQH